MYRSLQHGRKILKSLSTRYSPVSTVGVGYSDRSKYSTVNSVTDADIQFFKKHLGRDGVLTDDLDFYNEDWWGITKGNSKLVLRPRSTEEVSQILEYCNKFRIPIVPQGGNTGLVAGSTPIQDEVVLSLLRMNSITHFEENFGVIYCEGGTVLQQIEAYGEERGFTIPLDLGSKGSCTIGGNLGTHAGGLKVVRYGRLRGSVLGMKVVLADGTILDDMTTMRKDNTGYDLKQLFIGSEGTLGIITEVSLLLPPLPKSVNLVMMGCNHFDDIVKLCSLAKRDLGEIVSAIEYLDEIAMKSVVDHVSIPYPLENMHPHYFIVETSGMNMKHDKEKMEMFVDKIFELGLCADGVMAANADQAKTIFSLREMAAVGLKALGHNYQFDLSVPLQKIEELGDDIKSLFEPNEGILVAAIGHIGDNDIHFQVISPELSGSVLSKLEPYIYQKVNELGGSISSEHGIGSQKIDMLPFNKKKPILEMMHLLKKTLDPNNILNPGKLIRLR